jgi:natural product biosynthesis luciferase-like monooxygenase protein
MVRPSVHFSFLLLGEQSLLVQCAELLQSRGHRVIGVVTRNRQNQGWATAHDIPCHERFELLQADSQAGSCDYLLSITNLRMLPDWLLKKASKAAINFHDGPLPAYAGLNAPVWALMNNETSYGVSWHEIAAGADRGRILVQQSFPVAEDDTAFSLNAQCYQAGLDSFAELVAQLEQGALAPRAQDFSLRTYHGLADRPAAAATLDWSRPALELARLVRALDFGRYPNPTVLPKVNLGRVLLLARESRIATASGGVPGTILDVTATALTVACGSGALEISRLTNLEGNAVNVADTLQAQGLGKGSVLAAVAGVAELDAAVRRAAQQEGWWIDRLRAQDLTELPFGRSAAAAPGWMRMGPQLPTREPHELIASFLLLLARLGNSRQSAVAYLSTSGAPGPTVAPYFAPQTMLSATFEPTTPWSAFEQQVKATLDTIDAAGPWLSDLPAREPDLRAAIAALENSSIRLVRCAVLPDATALQTTGVGLMLVIDDKGQCGAWFDGARMSRDALDQLIASWAILLRGVQEPGAICGQVSVLSQDDEQQLRKWQKSHLGPVAMPPAARVHELIEAQAARSPDRRACVFDGQALTYRELNAAANKLARQLQSMGVKRGDLVGIKVPRSIEMLVSLLAVHKAGAAYVPLDPTYPAERLEFMAEDARLRVLLTHDTVRSALSGSDAPVGNLEVAGSPEDLAYVIYTSGSTGKPKGVMVEHRNVVNFFAGMDQRLGTDPGVWLAVTSISFDISVLELLWTLARGFTVVLHGDALRLKGQVARSAMPIDFGFFYWNVAKSENDYDAEKYRLLLESARFADTHGFNAVWTPERHFEAFGGLFPNPSVTSAALATITKNVKLRAGSCVVPLHSPIRIAEEWAVVDNLSNGRVGMSVASGWAPPDFAIRPESFANARQVMFESTEIVKRLWRGETVSFPGPKGEVKVRTLPRPIQKELPIWVTTAGNIDTYIQAGKAGANVLTHLLGQTIEEVAEKVVAYRKAWTDAGHSGRGVVTIMLHTLVGPDPEAVEEVVRQPMKDYLKSAVFLVKAAAWQFPTFKKLSDEQGKSLDDFFASISAQDMDDLLEFAFLRYFRTSGLFGTPEHCLEMVGRVKSADADEIACLIDFGIKTDVVLEHLPYLDQLRAMAQTAAAGHDYSLAALLQDEAVTHFQCTPTMATMLASDADSQPGLAGLKHMMVGGEAMPPDLARSLSTLVKGRVSNMYGPTETTVWSTVGTVDEQSITSTNSVSIGEPLLNQPVYVLDEQQQPLPVGLPGELVIGGAGVTRGYWQRPELTAEKFIPDPFQRDNAGARMYRTGDLARFLPDGRLECLGRLDQQIKIRGFRVELGEIEALLREQAGVAEAAAVLREVAPGDQRLVGYVRTLDGGDANAEALRAALSRHLPDFMVPSAIVSLKVMPQTPNGKIDRKALPLPTRAAPPAPATQASANAPNSGAEGLVMGIWQRALGVSQIGLRDNFFDIGGHSLLVIQVLKELREKSSRLVQMTDLFRHTTIESLARFLEGDAQADGAAKRGRSRADARRSALGGRPAAR